MPIGNPYDIAAIMFSLIREHLVFFDKSLERFTMRKQPGYYNYTERFLELFPGYMLDAKQAVIPHTAKTVNFDNLWKMLRSKDKSLLELKRW